MVSIVGPSHRRLRLAGMVACAAAILLLPPPLVGQIVWGGMTQEELDRAYDQDFWDNDPPTTQVRGAALADDMRARLGAPERLAYGPTEIEKLDLYRTAAPNAPIMVFIHGGAWRAGSAQTS